MRAFASALLLFLPGCAGAAPDVASARPEATTPAPPPVAPQTPDAIAVPTAQVLLLKANASGVQIYDCKAKADDAAKFEWSLKAPEADLTDDSGQKIGRHYAGPTWELSDGSKVVGAMKAKVDAPEVGAIPWLLVDAKSHEGSGILSAVTVLQRVATRGGKAPDAGCNADKAGTEVRVPYTATYYFYGASSH